MFACLLVVIAGDYNCAPQPIHHWERRTIEKGRAAYPLVSMISHGAAVLQCLFQATNKGALLEGLFQISERSGRQHTHVNFLIVKCGHEDDRREITLGNKSCLKDNTAHSW